MIPEERKDRSLFERNCDRIQKGIHIYDVMGRPLHKDFDTTIGRIGCCFCMEYEGSPFVMTPDKGVFYCYKCHAGGDVISYVSKRYNISPLGAVIKLAKEYDIELEG